MKSLRHAIECSSLPDLPRSARGLTPRLGLSIPTSVSAIIKALEVITLKKAVVTSAGFPLGGEVELTLRGDGSYTFKGFMRATGFTSYHYRLQVFVKFGGGSVIAAQQSGRVFGTDTPGPRQKNWEEPQSSPLLAAQWDSICRSAVLDYRLDAEISGIGGTLWDVLKTAAEAIVANAMLGPPGMAIVIGSELGAATGVNPLPPDVVAGVLTGVLVTGGIVLAFGPGVIVPAIAGGVTAGAIVASDIKHRSMTDAEKTFATKVFHSTLPVDRITLTNLSRDDGAKFVIPNLDGAILVNLGEYFNAPLNYMNPQDVQYGYTQPGSVFIHELVHTWQIAHTSFMPGLICDAVFNREYSYNSGSGWLTRPWSSFNLEQQAHIVEDWYETHHIDLNTPAALNDPAFRFIRDNIRAGQA